MFGELSADGNMDKSDPHPNAFYQNREPEVWMLGMAPDPKSRFWTKIIGRDATIKFPSDLRQPTGGTYAVNRQRLRYAGGHESHWTAADISNVTAEVKIPGTVEFELATRQFTNSTDNGNCFQSNPPGVLFDAPFGPLGTLVSIADRSPSQNTANDKVAGFSTILICDETTKRTYQQSTTGDVPPPGLSPDDFTSFLAIDGSRKTAEM
jgi:hypothetical protein